MFSLEIRIRVRFLHDHEGCLVRPGSVAHPRMATAAARWPVARGSAELAPRPRPIALQAGHFMIVSSLGQIAPKGAHDHETWSPPGTRAAGPMSGMRSYVLIEIALPLMPVTRR